MQLCKKNWLMQCCYSYSNDKASALQEHLMLLTAWGHISWHLDHFVWMA
jgi:hypothetical protein